jgi:hypothetical protein
MSKKRIGKNTYAVYYGHMHNVYVYKGKMDSDLKTMCKNNRYEHELIEEDGEEPFLLLTDSRGNETQLYDGDWWMFSPEAGFSKFDDEMILVKRI